MANISPPTNEHHTSSIHTIKDVRYKLEDLLNQASATITSQTYSMHRLVDEIAEDVNKVVQKQKTFHREKLSLELVPSIFSFVNSSIMSERMKGLVDISQKGITFYLEPRKIDNDTEYQKGEKMYAQATSLLQNISQLAQTIQGALSRLHQVSGSGAV